MKRIVIAILFAAALPTIAVAVAAPPAKVTIKMPGDLDFQFKPGPGSQLAATYCLTCHSSAYVSTQPSLDKAHWLAEAVKMRAAYGASIPDGDLDAIATYLATAYAPPPK